MFVLEKNDENEFKNDFQTNFDHPKQNKWCSRLGLNQRGRKEDLKRRRKEIKIEDKKKHA